MVMRAFKVGSYRVMRSRYVRMRALQVVVCWCRALWKVELVNSVTSSGERVDSIVGGRRDVKCQSIYKVEVAIA